MERRLLICIIILMIVILFFGGFIAYTILQKQSIDKFCEDASYKECYEFCESKEGFLCLQIVEKIIAKDKILDTIENG